MKLRVLLDMDGVIANFYRGFSKYLNERHGCTLNPNIEPKSYPFNDWGHGVDKINFDQASREWIQQNGFGKLPAFDGAEDFVKELMNLCNVYIVTARIGDWNQKFTTKTRDQIKQNTYDWLEQHGIPADNLFFAHDKIPFCQKNGISVIIEDKLSTALEAAKNGIHTILMDRGYNGSQINRFKIYRAYSFDEALNQLRKMMKQ